MIHRIILSTFVVGLLYSLTLIAIPASRDLLMRENVLYAALGVGAILAVMSSGDSGVDEEKKDGGEA